MNTTELQELVPQDKSDMERAQAVIELGYPAVAPILPQLLEWIQDCNWPVAHVLCPFLASIGEPLAPYVRNVLATRDTIWKAWVVSIVGESPSLVEAFREELENLATMTPQDEDEVWLQENILQALHPEASED
jgi:hypothetical protein